MLCSRAKTSNKKEGNGIPRKKTSVRALVTSFLVPLPWISQPLTLNLTLEEKERRKIETLLFWSLLNLHWVKDRTLVECAHLWRCDKNMCGLILGNNVIALLRMNNTHTSFVGQKLQNLSDSISLNELQVMVAFKTDIEAGCGGTRL